MIHIHEYVADVRTYARGKILQYRDSQPVERIPLILEISGQWRSKKFSQLQLDILAQKFATCGDRQFKFGDQHKI